MNGVAPNKENQARFEALVNLGCIVCRLNRGEYTPPQIHHIAGSKTQDGHRKTLPLCYLHHMGDQQLPANSAYVSRHPNKARFEKAYGAEHELLRQVDELIA